MYPADEVFAKGDFIFDISSDETKIIFTIRIFTQKLALHCAIFSYLRRSLKAAHFLVEIIRFRAYNICWQFMCGVLL